MSRPPGVANAFGCLYVAPAPGEPRDQTSVAAVPMSHRQMLYLDFFPIAAREARDTLAEWNLRKSKVKANDVANWNARVQRGTHRRCRICHGDSAT
jgi:hypothetical protein